MDEDLEISESGSSLRRWLITLAILALIWLVFRQEIAIIGRAFVLPIQRFFSLPVDQFLSIDQLLGLLGYIGLTLSGALALGGVVLYWMAGVVLPVRTAAERRSAMQRLWRSVWGKQPGVIFIKEGSLVQEATSHENTSPYLAIVDLSSAIVLERQWAVPSPGMLEEAGSPRGYNGGRRLAARIGRPGPVFIRRGEKLRNVVSLRKQFRLQPGIRAYTSDGIEVETNVYTLFTLGQPPVTLQVAYFGYTPDDLRVVAIEAESRKITAISDELDPVDKAEIHAYAQQYLLGSEGSWVLEFPEPPREVPPYTISEQRILAATYSQARRVGESSLEAWTELPPLVAAEMFRNMLSQVTYDALYLPEDAQLFPLFSEFKPHFARRMQMLGVLNYQLVHRLDGHFPQVGQRVDARSFRLSKVQELTASKVLRDRGIKVLHAGFSELKPTDPAILQQRLENWRARWQRETALVKANQELEVARVLNRARAEKQQEMISKLSQILQSSSFSEEALVLRIFQALEDVTTDPAARRILPRDTINMLRSLRLWLLPDENVPSALLEEKLSSEDE